MTTALGFVVGVGLLFYAILSSAGIGIFIDPPSIMVVGGGTLSAILISFPLPKVVGVFGVVKNIFTREDSDSSA